ncbi:MAG: 16S rRNA processing protein RimM [Chloroflexi bacterium]|nr:MAG: 16S rRNA processing protein RimM [Chloroflexota bacterium]
MAAAQHVKNTTAGSPSKGEPVYLAVGFLRRPHGVRGEIMLEIQTNHPEQFSAGAMFYVGKEHISLTIATRRQHNQGLLLSFEGINDRDEIGRFRNHYVYANIVDLPVLPDGEFYDYQLIGLEIIEEKTGEVLGELKEIIKTGANDVYLVRSESGREILLPAIPEVVLDVELAEGKMNVFLLPGLV